MPAGAVQSNDLDLETILGITISRIPENTIKPTYQCFKKELLSRSEKSMQARY